MIVLYIFLAILAFGMMIFFHELGHFVVARLCGVKVLEFAIGMGPALLKKTKKNGEIFSIRAFPLGGFCAFEGEDEDNPGQDAFNNQKPWKRIIVYSAGVFFNFLSVIVFSFILLKDLFAPSVISFTVTFVISEYLELSIINVLNSVFVSCISIFHISRLLPKKIIPINIITIDITWNSKILFSKPGPKNHGIKFLAINIIPTTSGMPINQTKWNAI